MRNPFVTKGYSGAEYFCDRVEETKNLIRLLTNENNMALISPRRLGKTDLIQHFFAQPEIKDRYYCFLIDIYATNSLSDFVEVFGRAIFDVLKPFGRKAWELFLTTIKSVQQQVSFDINGNPMWGVGVGPFTSPTTTLEEIFTYLNSADRPCIVAIDEFQKITEYRDGQNVEASLRTYIQRCTNATFLFSGSKRHLMTEIFLSPSRPFYQSVITMGLDVIQVEKYAEFATYLFSINGKKLDERIVPEVHKKFDGITAYLQRVMNVLFLNTGGGQMCTLNMLDEAIDYILDLNDEHYRTLFSQLSEKQRQVFLAISEEGHAKNITGSEFVKKYRLISPSSVNSAVRGLLEKDFITYDNGEYIVYDRFFQKWLERR